MTEFQEKNKRIVINYSSVSWGAEEGLIKDKTREKGDRTHEYDSIISFYLLFNRFADWQHIPLYSGTLRSVIEESRGGKTSHKALA